MTQNDSGFTTCKFLECFQILSIDCFTFNLLLVDETPKRFVLVCLVVGSLFFPKVGFKLLLKLQLGFSVEFVVVSC